MVSRPSWVALRFPASHPGGHKPNLLLPLQWFYDIFPIFGELIVISLWLIPSGGKNKKLKYSIVILKNICIDPF